MSHQSKCNKDSEAQPMDTEQQHQTERFENQQDAPTVVTPQQVSEPRPPVEVAGSHNIDREPPPGAMHSKGGDEMDQDPHLKAANETQLQEQPEEWPVFSLLDKTKRVTKKWTSACTKSKFDPLPVSQMNVGTHLSSLGSR